MSKIDSRLLSHAKGDTRKELEALIREAAPVLDRIRSIMEKELKSVETKLESEEYLLEPNIKERLIASLTLRRKLKDIIKLTTV